MKKFFKKLKSKQFIAGFLIVASLLTGGLFIYFDENQVLSQSAIYFMKDVNLPNQGQKVLVFSPHPDDETIGAGGYIAESIENGADVKIVLVTDGNKHGLKDKRYGEFKKATSILGVNSSNLVFLNYPDGGLNRVDQNSLVGSVKEQIDSYKPDFIICSSSYDTHPDHAKVGNVVDAVVKDESNKAIVYHYLIHRNNYPQPKRFEKDDYLVPPVKLVNFDNEWQRLMLPTLIEDKKIEAVKQYESQLKVPILRSTILSLIRKNELFGIATTN